LTDAGLISMQQKARVAQALAISGYTADSIAELLDLDVESYGLPSVQVQAPPDPVVEDD
jgi:hypothetical protein